MSTTTIMTKTPDSSDSPSNASATARKAMIDSQLRTSGVNEEYVLGRMISVPREDFLPEDKAGLAYIDRSVALGDDMHLASPLFYGKLLLEADPSPTDRVLIVEGGTSYLAELLGPLAAKITTASASDAAKGTLPDGAFSLVLVDGAIEEIPARLGELVENNGRIVSGLVERGVTRLASGRKIAEHIALEPVEDLGIPILHAFDRPKGWTF